MENSADSSSSADVATSVRSQTEYYFSDGNLAADQFLRNLILRDKEGYVPLKTIANFNRMKSLTTNMQVIIAALQESTELEVSSDETKVRRRSPMPEFNNQTSHRRTLVVEKLPEAANTDWLRSVFSKHGKVIRVRIYQPGSMDTWPRWLKNSTFNHDINTSFGLVEFGAEDESVRAKEAVQNAAAGSEELGLHVSWVQLKKNQGGANQGGNQQNRQQQQNEKRPKPRANGNNEGSGGDGGNGPSTSNGMRRGVQHDIDHPPGFQAYGQPQPMNPGRNHGNNGYPRGNARGGNHNFGGPSSSGGQHPAMDPGVMGMVPPLAAPPGTFIAAPPGAFGVPHGGMMYPQPMMHPGPVGPAGFQPYPPAAVPPRLALVPLPAMMPMTAGSAASVTPRQLSARAKSTPRGGNNANANGGPHRPRSTGRQPAPGQDGMQPGVAGEQPAPNAGNVRQQQRGQQQNPIELQQQHPKKGNNNTPRVLVVPTANDRQGRPQHPQPQPHSNLNHLHANQAQGSPNRTHPNQVPHNSINQAQGPNQPRRRSGAVAANNGTEGGDGAQPTAQGESGSDLGAGPQAGHTPEAAHKGKKQKGKKGKAKGAVEGEEGAEDAPTSGGKGGHQKRGNQHKHDKQHHPVEGQGEGGPEEEGQEWGKRRPRKDYARWAAATPDFRLQAVAATSKQHAAVGVVVMPEQLHKDGSHRIPRMPDGTKGFTMGRGKPLAAQQPEGSTAFLPTPEAAGTGAGQEDVEQPGHAGPIAPSVASEAVVADATQPSTFDPAEQPGDPKPADALDRYDAQPEGSSQGEFSKPPEASQAPDVQGAVGSQPDDASATDGVQLPDAKPNGSLPAADENKPAPSQPAEPAATLADAEPGEPSQLVDAGAVVAGKQGDAGLVDAPEAVPAAGGSATAAEPVSGDVPTHPATSELTIDRSKSSSTEVTSQEDETSQGTNAPKAPADTPLTGVEEDTVAVDATVAAEGAVAVNVSAADKGAMAVGASAADEGPVAVDVPAADKEAVAVDASAADEGPVAVDMSAADKGAVAVDASAADEGPVAVDASAADKGAVAVDASAADEGPVAVDVSAADKGPVAVDASAADEGAVAQEATVKTGSTPEQPATGPANGEGSAAQTEPEVVSNAQHVEPAAA